MKEIGEFLKSSRISNGVSLEEAAEDLKLDIAQLENIEDGNIRAFKDIYQLREFVKEYSKYLGIKTDIVLDEFNDFMFEHTSKISLDDIKEAKKVTSQKQEKKVFSPYTKIRKQSFKFNYRKIKSIIIAIFVIFMIMLVIFIWFKFTNQQGKITSELQKNMEVKYEFTY